MTAILRRCCRLVLAIMCASGGVYGVQSAEDSVSADGVPAQYESVHYKFSTTKWLLPFIQDNGVSGPFVVAGLDTFIFVSRCGLLSLVERKENQMVLVAQQALPFAEEVYCSGGPVKTLAGVKDLLIGSEQATVNGDLRLYVSYVSEPLPGCIALKVVRLDAGITQTILFREKVDLFQSECAPTPPTYTQAGGALAETPSHLYFSVGDFGHGRARPSTSDRCSIFRLEKTTNAKPDQFAIGIRNSEGLALVPNSNPGGEPVLFATDMGPRGGDEIDVVKKGDDFGFSDKSYGINYDHDTSTDYAGPWDDHSIGKEPEYVFMPSVAPTDITYYDGAMFKSWRGSLLMATLRAQTLYRVRLNGERVVYSEPIATLGERMRFIRTSPDGSLYVKADPDRFIRVYRDANVNGQPIGAAELVVSKGCLGCHNPLGTGSAPSLRGMSPTAIYENLNYLAAGIKGGPVMSQIAKSLSYQERQAVADYIAALE